MTFNELIDILGLQESKHGTTQTKEQWIKFYFTAWKLTVKNYNIVRYRNDNNGIFDGTVEFNGKYINFDKNFGKLEITIGNYKRLFIDVFENENFKINFKDSI